MKEEWKDIKEFEGLYQVSNTGKVKSLDRTVIRKDGVIANYKECILKGRVMRNGYLAIFLSKNGKYKSYYIHRLVAEAFIPNLDNLPEIDHIDTDKTNNGVENLRWVTHVENMNNPRTKEMRYGNCEKSKNINKNTMRIISQETKDKIREIKSIKVVQLDKDTNEPIKIWSSAMEAQRERGFDHGHIIKCCKGNRKTHKGYKWMYYEDYIKLNEKGE